MQPAPTTTVTKFWVIARFLTRLGSRQLVHGIPVLPLRKRLVAGLTLIEVLVVVALAGIFLALFCLFSKALCFGLTRRNPLSTFDS